MRSLHEDGADVVVAEPAASRLVRGGAPARRPITITAAALLALGASVVFWAVFSIVLSGVQEQRSQHQLYASFRGLLDPSSPDAPKVGGAISSGFPVALVDAPAAGIHDLMVVQGTSAGDTMAGPGHLPDTPLPGQAGVSVVLGRSVAAGAPFAHLDRLRPGDVVTVRTGEGLFSFGVVGTVAPGRPLPARVAGSGALLLGTEPASGILGLGGDSHLKYVEAVLKGAAAPTPAGQPRHAPSADTTGQGDSGAWPWVLLWFAALAAATAACWWLWDFWGLGRTWLVGAPVLLAVMWGFSSEALRLLPNVL